ncbi:MAG: hypothetical protein HN389_10625 [Clostridia bacterium]|jgi:hypothetical protein|nr:hypothetical protein [Clostridia bacterium]
MICAKKRFFVHTLATVTCRTVVIGFAKAIRKRFVFAIGSWVFIGSANEHIGEGRGVGFFANARNDGDVKNIKVSLVQLLQAEVNAREAFFDVLFAVNLLHEGCTKRQQAIA